MDSAAEQDVPSCPHASGVIQIYLSKHCAYEANRV